jgi:hypothetical protein
MITVSAGVSGKQFDGIVQRNKADKSPDTHHSVVQQQRWDDVVKRKPKDGAMGFPGEIVDTEMVGPEK